MTDQATVKPITADDLIQMDVRGILREVINGQWVEMAGDGMAGKRHGRIEARLIYLLMRYTEPRQLGYVYPGDTTFVLEGTPDAAITVRMPDVAFVAAGREDDTSPDDPHYLAPDLAIEIISPSERYSDSRAKLHDYLRTGVKQVWQILPDQQEVVVHFPDGTAVTYRHDQEISGGDVLPGFTITPQAIFEQIG